MLLSVLRRDSVVVDLLCNALPIVCGRSVHVITLCHFSFATIFKMKRKLVALL